MPTGDNSNKWTPLIMSLSIIVGVMIGAIIGRFNAGVNSYSGDRKLNTMLNLIQEQYVDDSVNVNDLMEMAIPHILENLDPHSVYLPAKEVLAAQQDLDGSFSGVGIQFQPMNDTIHVVEVIPGGPSDKVGLMAGDRIIEVDDTTFVGKNIDANVVRGKLRGPKGSKVKVGVKRTGVDKTLYFEITRGDIPLNSVDAAYMVDKTTGYVKVNQFGARTYDEFVNAMQDLETEGAKRYIVDLRGNGGGYLEIAVKMCNEFLPERRLIVSTKGRYRRDDQQVYSDGTGHFQSAELVVLIDEFSASASEIFAGAIQDNDRGLVVGRRSFGKGLVQKQFTLPDKSAVRLTIARYYTPSGRCIQKPYSQGELAYELDLKSRSDHGELFNRDSIKVNEKEVYHTSTGRMVYGGGGIIPDIFVPRDTTGYGSSYFQTVIGAGLPQQYALKYVDAHRAQLEKMEDYKQLLRNLPSNEQLLSDFVEFASKQGVPARSYYINQARDILTTYIKALIARDALGMKAYYPILNRSDNEVETALKALNKHKAAFPITD